MAEKDRVPGPAGEVARCADAVAWAARSGPVLLACAPGPVGVVASAGVGYLAHVGARELELCRDDACRPRSGQTALGALDDGDREVVALARRVARGFAAAAGREAARRALLACTADDDAAPEAVHRYLRLGFAEPRAPLARPADERVREVGRRAQEGAAELAQVRRFARFSPRRDSSFVAVVAPSANVLPLAGGHFARLMAAERFCLVDPRHRMALFHERHGARCCAVRLDERLARGLVGTSSDELAENGRAVRALWGCLRDHVSRPGRGADALGIELETTRVTGG
ncbi:DUF4130 domain-containing protein [Thermophilibacter sp.]